jgi:hypothetical protein
MGPAQTGEPKPSGAHFALQGTVVSAHDASPVRHTPVLLLGGQVHPEKREVNTDDQGHFEFRFADDHEFGLTCSASVDDCMTSGGSETVARTQRFDGSIRLEQGLVLVACDTLILRGKFDDLSGSRSHEVTVAAFVPHSRGLDAPQFVKSGFVGSDGSFAMAAVLGEALPPFVHLEVNDQQGVIAVLRTATSDLISAQGAKLHVGLVPFECSIVDDEGKPVPRADIVTVFSNSSADATPVHARSNSSGAATLKMAAGEIELVANAKDHATRVARTTVVPGAPAFEIVLRRLMSTDTVVGRVLLPNGEPASHAELIAIPATVHPNFAGGSAFQGKTNERGELQLRAACNTDLPWIASGFEHGLMSPPRVARTGEPLELELVAFGSLRVDIDLDGAAGPFHSGEIEGVVYSHARDRTTTPTPIGNYVHEFCAMPGEYDIFVRVPSCDRYAQTTVTVHAGEHAQTSVTTQPARWIDGRVLDAQGRPVANLRVIAHSSWPDAVARALGSAITDGDGRFRALTNADDARIEVCASAESGELHPAHVGEPLTVELH